MDSSTNKMIIIHKALRQNTYENKDSFIII